MAELAKTSLNSDANLKAYYKLENANDSTATAYNLTNYGTTPFNSAKYSNGADFGTANSSRYLSIGNALGIDGGAISISCWVKIATQISAGHSFYTFVEQDSNNTKTQYYLAYQYNSGTPRLIYNRGRLNVSSAQLFYNVTLTPGTWYHLVLTYNGTTLKSYFNGSEVNVGGTAASGNGTGTWTDTFIVGKDYTANSGSDYFYGGMLDDIAVFNRALTAAEVTTLYTDPPAAGGGFLLNFV